MRDQEDISSTLVYMLDSSLDFYINSMIKQAWKHWLAEFVKDLLSSFITPASGKRSAELISRYALHIRVYHQET